MDFIRSFILLIYFVLTILRLPSTSTQYRVPPIENGKRIETTHKLLKVLFFNFFGCKKVQTKILKIK